VVRCRDCGATWNFYFTKGGGIFTWPREWGRPIAILNSSEPEGAFDEQGKPMEDCTPFLASPYYVFVGEDGTIRRARMYEIPGFVTDGNEPQRKHFHQEWCVDVLPCRPAREVARPGGQTE
jgi:hypothetical protein